MGLSQQDRDRIFEEERVRRDAQEQFKAEDRASIKAKTAKAQKYGLIVGLGVGIIVLWSIIIDGMRPHHPEMYGHFDVNTAAIGEITSESVDTFCPCAPTSEALDRILEAWGTEKFNGIIGKEATRAGWEGPILLGKSDRLKILEKSRKYKSGEQARVLIVSVDGDSSPNRLDFAANECWIPTYVIHR